MGINFKPAQTGFSRVFLIEGRARPDHRPDYQSTAKAGGVSQGFGDVEKIEVPSPDEFGKFVEVGQIRGAVERATIPLTSRYAADIKSEFLRLARKGCAIDLQINIGACTDPSNHNVFTKKLVMEGAFLTSFETEDIGALGSDEQAKVDESLEISATDVYEIVPVSFASRGGDIVTNELLDVVICGTPSCGDCNDESDGCQAFFAISKAAGGSPSTPADVVFSLDKGSTWFAHDIDSMGIGDDPDAIACVGSYMAVVSQVVSSGLHYALLSEFDGSTDPDFTQVTSGFVSGGEPTCIISVDNMAFIAGLGGYIYSTEDPTSGVTVIDAGVAHTDDYLAIDAVSSEFAVAVGQSGIIAKTTNGIAWTSVASPVGIGIGINTIAVKNESEWFIGTDAGKSYYTLDGGTTWAENTFFGSGSGSVEDIVLAGNSVMYMSHTTSANAGRMLRSTNGGYDWVVLPEGIGALPVNDKVGAIAACVHNPDVVVGVGLADDGNDGFIVVGTD